MARRSEAIILVLLATACGNGAPREREIVQDQEFLAFVDANGDGLSFNDEPQTIRLSDYFASNRPGTEIVMVNAAAGWCGPCMVEASALKEFAAEYEPRGVAILTAVFQDQNFDPADSDFVREWAESFELSVPALIDSDFATSRYFDVNTMPANMFVDAKTGEILVVAAGAEPGTDPMREYRELLDYQLQGP
jgi:thiol-disulfide isomerase/thioredoxin